MTKAGGSSDSWNLWLIAILTGAVINLLLFGALSSLGNRENPPPSPRVIALTLDFAKKTIQPVITAPKPETAKPRTKKVRKQSPRRLPRPQRTPVRRTDAKTETEEAPQEAVSPPASVSSPDLPQPAPQQVLPEPVPVYRLSGLPRFIHQEKPAYPPHLRQQGKEATVKLEIYIDATGKVRNIRVLKSAGTDFDQAAIAAIRASTFAPGNVAGKPVPVLMRLPIRFRLR